MIPGQYKLQNKSIICNENKQVKKLLVTNIGDRPIQVGSHFHFFEVNRALQFERDLGVGMRLNIPAGTAVRFEPGDQKKVELIPFSGERKIFGLNNLTNDALDKGV
ncbi:urease subunit beta [Bacillus weihaiensis]|uniref:Urease subunit beta n=1 Tax=Bacillus weihaiensis TaxID=1547283 RepID=A0A1L3MQ80_9BACI|nr:urease subunit beta [Bacillus weihaiensis]APH04495.1 urease subunit beta [Bacillus weihaiensis]